MAIIALTMDNFLGKSVTHSFGKHNRIAGANGTGKSSIKEALCFLFTGCDSSGTRNPQHLISLGQHNMKITVVTDKAEISRTLTKNGNGTIKVIKAGISQTYTQNELEAIVGPTNVFLAAFIPGYFLGMSSEKQHAVLSEVLPKIPKELMLKELTGIELTSEELLRWGVKMKRVDLVKNAVALDRREMERQKDTHIGSINTYKSVQLGEAPTPPSVEIAALAAHDAAVSEWSAYEKTLRAYEKSIQNTSLAVRQNEDNQIRRDALKKAIAELVESDEMVVPDYTQKISELRAKVPSEPVPPALFNIIDADNCPTCGQTVGVKHREKTAAHNNNEKQKYEAALAEYESIQKDILHEIVKLENETGIVIRKNDQIRKSNETIKQSRHKYELQLAAIVDVQIPEPLPATVAPTTPAPEEAVGLRLKSVIKAYDRAVIEFEQTKKLHAEAATKIEELSKLVTSIDEAVTRLRSIEDGFSKVPQEEMRRQVELLKMDTVQLTVADSIVVTKGGIHYNHLSTGQRMSADIEICRKIGSLMSKPLNMIFLDNADLVDQFDWGNYQMFAAFVDVTKQNVVIEENTL